MQNDSPKNLDELVTFYYEYVKPLYSEVQTLNALPQETLTELLAAFDHVTRISYYGEPEEKAIDKAYGHLKRSCLDVFKIELRETINLFKEIKSVDTSSLDEGEFDIKLSELFNEIRRGAKEARLKEGEFRTTGETQHAFKLWQPVFDNCKKFQKQFYYSRKFDWAKNRKSQFSRKSFFLSVLASLIAGSILTLLTQAFVLA